MPPAMPPNRCRSPRSSVDPRPPSIARTWNEALLSAIRIDRARPPVQARNLFHTSAAMYDIWAAYDGTADTYLFGHPGCESAGALPPDPEASEREAISYAMYRLIRNRFSGSPGIEQTYADLDALMLKLGYDITDISTDYSAGSAAALGNYVAECYANFGLADGSNEAGLHGNTYYQPVNEAMQPPLPGAQAVADLDHWQPLLLDVFIDQSGNIIVGGAPPFVGAEWGNVTPFAMTPDELTTNHRDSNGDGVMDTFKVYHDPGSPPSHLGDTADEFWWNFALVAKWSGQLDQADGVMIDVSPASIGNDPGAERPLPTTFAEYQAFYDSDNGGDRSPGHAINPATGEPYAPQIVRARRLHAHPGGVLGRWPELRDPARPLVHDPQLRDRPAAARWAAVRRRGPRAGRPGLGRQVVLHARRRDARRGDHGLGHQGLVRLRPPDHPRIRSNWTSTTGRLRCSRASSRWWRRATRWPARAT